MDEEAERETSKISGGAVSEDLHRFYGHREFAARACFGIPQRTLTLRSDHNKGGDYISSADRSVSTSAGRMTNPDSRIFPRIKYGSTFRRVSVAIARGQIVRFRHILTRRDVRVSRGLSYPGFPHECPVERLQIIAHS